MGRKFYYLTGYNNTYKINKDGKLKNINGSDKVLYKEKNGYLSTPLMLNNNQKTNLIHRLVAKQFIPNPENKPEVNHKNGIKDDNRVENLEWCTKKENQQHAVKSGLLNLGKCETHIAAKLSNLDVIDIYTSGLNTNKLAKKYNVSRHNIQHILLGLTWSFVTNGLTRRLSKVSQDRINKRENEKMQQMWGSKTP